LDELVSNITDLKKNPGRIECYDISNLFGKDATGSMVVATDGRINKSEYRKFRIKFKKTPDDYEMMREVLRRRFKREKSKNKNLKKWGTPDLIVLDGGKGQVSAALDVLREYDLDIAVVGLAKRYETLVLSDHSEVSLPSGSQGLRLLQKLRDEAHRFAKKYHLQLRLRKIKG
jgi:excinuclease ABC subunit C